MHMTSLQVNQTIPYLVLLSSETFSVILCYSFFTPSLLLLSFLEEHLKLPAQHRFGLTVVEHVFAWGASFPLRWLLLKVESKHWIGFWHAVWAEPEADSGCTSPAAGSHVCFMTNLGIECCCVCVQLPHEHYKCFRHMLIDWSQLTTWHQQRSLGMSAGLYELA